MRNLQSGQTLIETMVAIIVLVVGITASLSLANYALHSSSNVIKQLIATGLAREGVESVKAMRDTNWLRDTLSSSCYDFPTAQATGLCYPNWLTSLYNLRGTVSGKSMILSFDPLSSSFWTIAQQDSNYRMRLDTSGSVPFYNHTSGALSDFYRKITLTEDATGAIYSQTTGPRLLVTVQVWWADKNCPAVSADTFPTTGSCRIQLQTYLTNWKNY